jgi:hypothetical protein
MTSAEIVAEWSCNLDSEVTIWSLRNNTVKWCRTDSEDADEQSELRECLPG